MRRRLGSDMKPNVWSLTIHIMITEFSSPWKASTVAVVYDLKHSTCASAAKSSLVYVLQHTSLAGLLRFQTFVIAEDHKTATCPAVTGDGTSRFSHEA